MGRTLAVLQTNKYEARVFETPSYFACEAIAAPGLGHLQSVVNVRYAVARYKDWVPPSGRGTFTPYRTSILRPWNKGVGVKVKTFPPSRKRWQPNDFKWRLNWKSSTALTWTWTYRFSESRLRNFC